LLSTVLELGLGGTVYPFAGAGAEAGTAVSSTGSLEDKKARAVNRSKHSMPQIK